MQVEMATRYLLVLTIVAALLAGCGKPSTTTPATPDATATSAPPSSTASTPATSPATTTAAASKLPDECAAYYSQVESCISRMGPGGAQFRQALAQSKAQHAVTDVVAAVAACTQAKEKFKETAKALHC